MTKPRCLPLILLAACGGSSDTQVDAPAQIDAPHVADAPAVTRHVTAHWTFEKGGSAAACPVDAPTASLVSQPIQQYEDPTATDTGDTGTATYDMVPCGSNTVVSSALAPGLYREYIEFGAPPEFGYEALQQVVDLTTADATYSPPPVALDAGHFLVGWGIFSQANPALLRNCSDVAATHANLDVTGSGGFTSHIQWPCLGEDACPPTGICDGNGGGGYTGNVPIGTFDLTVTLVNAAGSAVGSGSALGLQQNFTNNGVTPEQVTILVAP